MKDPSTDIPPADTAPRTATGRVPGPRGMDTRRRLLEEVERRCIHIPYHHVTVTEIAAAAETSAATFYHYFPDVPSAAAEVAEAHFADFAPVVALAEHIAAAGPNENDCRQLVAEFIRFWEPRPGLLEALIIADPEGDPTYLRVLHHAVARLSAALAPAVPVGHKLGVAGALVMMLCHATARRQGFARDGVPPDALADSLAVVLHAALTTA